MSRIVAVFLLLALTLAGCATSGEKAALSKAEGQPISNLINMFGEPDEVESEDGGNVYIWRHSESVGLMTAKASTAFSQTTVDAKCQFTVYTGADKVVTKAKLKGDYYVCGLYTNKLQRS
jgi:hypothetical protein